ncbi:MAG TPA: SH3 domain-containing protein [Humisphaera sp.]|jgi:uncharacterized protein YgiM (DUF1202 family)|nr:SH3 domain-containing protein [Humisphaera sp.]
MAARRVLFFATLALALTATVISPTAFAQDAGGQEETAKQPFVGQINANAVFVRSAAREDAYPVTKLDKGSQVTVVGIKFKWLKILPPKGSFGYVPKAYIDRHGSGNTGKASREMFAKVGSDLMEVKTAQMAKVEVGQEVTIIGEKDEYYKIEPPEGSYLYIAQQFVDPVKPIASADVKNAQSDAKAVAATGGTSLAIVDGLTKGNNGSGSGVATPPSTQPTGSAEKETAEATPPSTQPADAITTATNAFDSLEADFKAANEKPIVEQPISQLLVGYEDMLKQDALPASMRRVAEIRIATLKLRDEAKQEFVATRASQEKSAERRKALEAERGEIQERIKQTEITVYAALGTLRTSSIQRGTQTLYRLTDPATGRTLAYLRTSDPKYATLLGQFVGVKGTLSVDPALNMKMIDAPTETVAVDQAKINKTITAQVVPPSLMTVRSASTNE